MCETFADQIQRAETAARRAIELDFDNPVAHATLAWITGDSGQHDLAVKHAQRALAISPNEVSGLLSMGRVLTFGGRADEAPDPLLSAVQRNPNDPFGSLLWATLAACHYFRRDFAACAEISRRMLQDFPEFTLIHRWLAASLDTSDLAMQARPYRRRSRFCQQASTTLCNIVRRGFAPMITLCILKV